MPRPSDEAPGYSTTPSTVSSILNALRNTILGAYGTTATTPQRPTTQRPTTTYSLPVPKQTYLPQELAVRQTAAKTYNKPFTPNWPYAQGTNYSARQASLNMALRLAPRGTIGEMQRPDTSGLPQQTGYYDYNGGGWSGGWNGGGWSGGGGGGEAAPAEITWSEFDSGVGDKPSWWKALKPSQMNTDTEYLSTLNLLIPFLSPEDQKTVASTIYQMDAKNFGHLNPEGIDVKPENPIADATEVKFESSERARKALSAMTALAGAVGKKDSELGPGYRYLRSIIDVADKFGAKDAINRQTRAQYQQMLAALDPLLAESSGSGGVLAPYGSLVKMLSQPFFSMGQLRPVQKTTSGKYSFGNPNSALL